MLPEKIVTVIRYCLSNSMPQYFASLKSFASSLLVLDLLRVTNASCFVPQQAAESRSLLIYPFYHRPQQQQTQLIMAKKQFSKDIWLSLYVVLTTYQCENSKSLYCHQILCFVSSSHDATTLQLELYFNIRLPIKGLPKDHLLFQIGWFIRLDYHFSSLTISSTHSNVTQKQKRKKGYT